MRYQLLCALLLAGPIRAPGQIGAQLPDDVYNTPGPHVVVNGVSLKAPVMESNGSLLLPMRAVFEALNARVRWFPAAQQITATRGDTSVQLWIRRPVAIVNDREIELAAAPILSRGSTYVPLRFPAEAFGGEVKWIGTLRTAVITIAPLAVARPPAPVSPAPPAAVVQPKPAPRPVVVEGVLVTKVNDRHPALLLRHANGDTILVKIPSAAQIVRSSGGRSAAASFGDLALGDRLRVTSDPDGDVTVVEARCAQSRGTVAAIANNRLLLRDGSVYELEPDVRVTDTEGRPVPLSQVGTGSSVTLEVTPETTDVWRIVVPERTAPRAPALAPGETGILTVAAVGCAKPLRAGDTFTLQVTGLPHAERVTASVGDALRDIMLAETAPGTYTRAIGVAPNVNVTGARVLARMRIAGRDLDYVGGASSVTIDTRPPSFSALVPGNGARLSDRNPTIEASYADPGGSGVDPSSVRIVVNGRDVSRFASITDSRLVYQARGLPLGQATVHIEVADRAGNPASADWAMSVVEVGGPVAQYMRHDAPGPVMPGGRLNLACRFGSPPVRLEWYFGDRLVGTTMARDAPSGEYRIALVVDPATPPGQHSVRVHAYDDHGRAQVLFAPTPVVVAARPREFRITTPSNRTRATSPLTVSGEATPGARVRVTVACVGHLSVVELKGKLYSSVLIADRRGVWTTEAIDIRDLLMKPDTYTVTAEQLDQAGKVANTAKIDLAR